MAQLCLPEVRHNPPSSRIDESEYLLPCMCIGTLGDRHVGNAGIEWCIHFGMVEVVLRRFDSRASSRTLCYQWLQGEYTVRGLLYLLVALFELSRRLLVGCIRGVESSFRQCKL